MAHSYKVIGKTLATTSQTSVLTAASTETLIVRSIRVTNKTSNTPTVTLDVTDTSASATYRFEQTKSLAANTAYELLTQPLVLEASDILKVTMSSTDSTDLVISYLSVS